MRVAEERRRREVKREDHEVLDGGLDVCVLEAEAVAGVGARGDGLRLRLEGALEDAVDDAGAWFFEGAAEGGVQVVEEPGEEVDGVGLRRQGEALVASLRDFLEELVWGDVSAEGTGVPDLADEHAEALREFRAGGEVFEHEEVAERRDVG